MGPWSPGTAYHTLSHPITPPNTPWERVADKAALKIANVKIHQDICLPILGEEVGQTAYIWYGTGIPARVKVNRKHPIFSVCPEERWTIRHIGGPAFVEMEGKSVDILATYQEELSDIAPVHVWKWGPFHREAALSRDMFQEFAGKGFKNISELRDWDKQEETVKT